MTSYDLRHAIIWLYVFGHIVCYLCVFRHTMVFMTFLCTDGRVFFRSSPHLDVLVSIKSATPPPTPCVFSLRTNKEDKWAHQMGFNVSFRYSEVLYSRADDILRKCKSHWMMSERPRLLHTISYNFMKF